MKIVEEHECGFCFCKRFVESETNHDKCTCNHGRRSHYGFCTDCGSDYRVDGHYSTCKAKQKGEA